MAKAAVPKRQVFVRPRSEIITVLDWRQVLYNDKEQCGPSAETCLDEQFFEDEERKPKTAFVCGSYEFAHGESEESDNEVTPESEVSEVNISATELQRSVLTINVKPVKFQPPKPRLVKAQSMASLPRRRPELESIIGPQCDDKNEERSRMHRRKSSLDVSLAKLRHEMNSLRRQDTQLLEQLLNLNNSIQEFKLSQSSLSESISNLSEESDESEHLEIPIEKPFKTRRWRSRGSLGSDAGSDYHSASSRSSTGSNYSLSGSDVASSDSGHESLAGLKSSMKRSKGKFGSGDLRRVSFEKLKGRSRSEVFDNGSSYVLPAQAVRRSSAQFRVAELKSIQTLSKRQSTIW